MTKIVMIDYHCRRKGQQVIMLPFNTAPDTQAIVDKFFKMTGDRNCFPIFINNIKTSWNTSADYRYLIGKEIDDSLMCNRYQGGI